MADDYAYNEIWVNYDDGQAMQALINGKLGYLRYLREPGDVGFSSRNPNYSGTESALVDYLSADGQGHEYPAAWALPIDVVNKALMYFRQQGRPPLFVSWHNDSGDGIDLNSPR